MKLRPCIDIHNGHVVQIVGSSLNDEGDKAKANFISEKNSTYYSGLYKEKGLNGGHIILLNGKDSEYFGATRDEAIKALETYPEGMQIGGGITAENAKFFIDKGASHVIVTSYVFSDGKVCYNNLSKLIDAVGKEHVVLDISCKRKGDKYFVATNRWQVISDTEFNADLLKELSEYCDEYLVHAVDVEGKKSGINEEIAKILKESPIPVTYAGGISTYEDIRKIADIGDGKIDFTIGTALDIFGGDLSLEKVIECTQY